MKPIKASFEGSSEYFFKVFLCDCEADFLLRSLISIDVETNFKFLPGGVSPSERGLAWRFLFGMYSCSSTALERSLLQEQLMVRYQVMKRKWQQLIPSAVRMHLNNSDGKRHKRRPMFTKKKNPIYLLNVSLFFSFGLSFIFQLSWLQLFSILTRDKHRPSSRPWTCLRRSEKGWLSWSFRHRSDRFNGR